MNAAASHPLTIASSKVFWSVVDAPGVRAGPLPEGLWVTLEDEVPIPIDLLWAICIPVDQDTLAVCAILRTELDAVLPGTLRLTPDRAPEFITLDPARFNFFIGMYEPTSIRRTRLHRGLAIAAAILFGAGVVAIGFTRRAAAWYNEAVAARQATAAIIAATATSPTWTQDNLVLELQQRQLAVTTEEVVPADAAEALAAVIARWPTHAPSSPQSISATGTAASISVTVPGDAQAFLAALSPPPGWTLDEPRLAAVDKATRLNLELRRGDSR